jgi:hypothetical protein
MMTTTRNTGIGNFGKVAGCFHAGKDNAFYYRLFWCGHPGYVCPGGYMKKIFCNGYNPTTVTVFSLRVCLSM